MRGQITCTYTPTPPPFLLETIPPLIDSVPLDTKETKEEELEEHKNKTD